MKNTMSSDFCSRCTLENFVENLEMPRTPVLEKEREGQLSAQFRRRSHDRHDEVVIL